MTGTTNKNNLLGFFQNRGSRHYSFHGKLWKTKENKDKAGLRRTGFASLGVGYVWGRY